MVVLAPQTLDRRLFEGKLLSAIVYPEFFPLQSSERVVNLGCGVGPQVAIYRGQFREMVCIDLSADRIRQLEIFMAEQGMRNYTALVAPVEATGLPSSSFDRALCIDIIEHLSQPLALLQEVHRLLRPGGTALVTIPIMHDRWVHLARTLKRVFGKLSVEELPMGHPDRHNTDLSRVAWLALFRKSPLCVRRVRATTLFPPLHLAGLPRFWFTLPWVHTIDRFLCSLPLLRRLGQAWMCILEKTHE